MLDHPEKTARLLTSLKAAAPFEVELAPSLIEHLQAENVADADRAHHVVWDLSYAGDEGGIMCHIVTPGREGIVISLTYIRVPRTNPFAVEIVNYQKHRVTKIKKGTTLRSSPSAALRARRSSPVTHVLLRSLLVPLR